MVGLIDVGGGLRDIYGAGVLDFCLAHGIFFPYCIGISAGSANIASYLAGQQGRNYRFYTDYALRPEYISLANWRKNGSYVNLDYGYSALTNSDGEDPLDYDALEKNPAAFWIVATDANTGKPVYFSRNAIGRDNYDVLKASSSLPMFNKPYIIGGKPYYDGGISDPIPVEKALSDGCRKVVVILTRPVSSLRNARRDRAICLLLRRSHPEAAAALAQRYRVYNEAVARLRLYQKGGKVLIIAPDSCCGMKTLTKDTEKMEQLYRKGLQDGAKILPFLHPDRTASIPGLTQK